MINKLAFSILVSTSLLSSSFAARTGGEGPDTPPNLTAHYTAKLFSVDPRPFTIDPEHYESFGLPPAKEFKVPGFRRTVDPHDAYMDNVEASQNPRRRKKSSIRQPKVREILTEQEARDQIALMDVIINNLEPDDKESMMKRAFLQLHKAALVQKDILYRESDLLSLTYGCQHAEYEKVLYDAAMTLSFVADTYLEEDTPDRLELLKAAVAALRLPLQPQQSLPKIKHEETGVLASDLLMEITALSHFGIRSDRSSTALPEFGGFFEIFGVSSRPQDCARYWAAELLAQAGMVDNPQGGDPNYVNRYGPRINKILMPMIDWLNDRSQEPIQERLQSREMYLFIKSYEDVIVTIQEATQSDQHDPELVSLAEGVKDQLKRQLFQHFWIAPEFATSLWKKIEAKDIDAATFVSEASTLLRALRAEEASRLLYRLAGYLNPQGQGCRDRADALVQRASELFVEAGRAYDNASYFFRFPIVVVLNSGPNARLNGLTRARELYQEGMKLSPGASWDNHFTSKIILKHPDGQIEEFEGLGGYESIGAELVEMYCRNTTKGT